VPDPLPSLKDSEQKFMKLELMMTIQLQVSTEIAALN
jgi:hypothetical protein